MKLEDYLEAIANSPDSDLTEEHGVYDNYCIAFLGDAENLADALEATGRFKIRLRNNEKLNKSPNGDYIFVEYLEGFTDASIKNYEVTSNTTPEFRDYSGTIMLHIGMNSEDPRKEKSYWLRGLADCITDISSVIVENNIPAYFHCSLGWKHLKADKAVQRGLKVFYNPSQNS